MRKSSLIHLIAAFLMLVGASSASATTVNLLWTASSDAGATGIGTSTIGLSTANPGVLLTLDLVIGIDAAGLSAYGLDVEFDTDLDNELDIVSFQELSWENAKATRTLGNITVGIVGSQESTASVEGQVFGFEAFTLGTGAANLTLTFARMVFVTTGAVNSDGLDLFSSNERDPFATAFIDNAGIQLNIPAFGATVNLPEPQSVALLVLAIGTLTAAGWKRG